MRNVLVPCCLARYTADGQLIEELRRAA